MALVTGSCDMIVSGSWVPYPKLDQKIEKAVVRAAFCCCRGRHGAQGLPQRTGPTQVRPCRAHCAQPVTCSAASAPQPLRIGTRGSPLALAQAHLARDLLQARHRSLKEEGDVEIVTFTTGGDVNLAQALGDIGGQGLFTREIDEALLEGRVDVGVHSMKDVPVDLLPGISLACVLPREDVRDALISLKAKSLGELPAGAVVGSASTRRQAQVLARYPHLKVATLRGSVQSRLQKLEEGACDATLLALAGLRRLGMEGRACCILSTEEMLPAVGQGAIGIVCREGDHRTQAALAAISHEDTRLAVVCERAFLWELKDFVAGPCRAAIAGLAQRGPSGQLVFRGLVAQPDGSGLLETHRTGGMTEAEAAAMGKDAGEEVRAFLQGGGGPAC